MVPRHQPVIFLLGTVMQAKNSASPVQGQDSLAAQPGGSAVPAALQVAKSCSSCHSAGSGYNAVS